MKQAAKRLTLLAGVVAMLALTGCIYAGPAPYYGYGGPAYVAAAPAYYWHPGYGYRRW